MADKKSMVVADEIKFDIVEAETKDLGLVSESTVEAVARNLVEHYRGQISGGYIPLTRDQIKAKNGNYPPNWRKTHDINGKEIMVRPGGKKEKGLLLMSDAVRVTRKTISRGLNPMAHISLWYHNGQLIDHVNYAIVKGMGEQQHRSSVEYADMSSDERSRHKLNPKDIGKVAYLILDKDKPLYLQATVAFAPELGFKEAKRQAMEMISKAKGTGIVRSDEGLYIPKGRSIEWVAEKRAMTDAVKRSYGEMTPAQIAHYASGQGFVQQQDLEAIASPDYRAIAQLPPDIQQRWVEGERQAKEIKAIPKRELEKKSAKNIQVMRGGYEDEDPLGEQKPLSPAMDLAGQFWGWVVGEGISRNKAGPFLQETSGDFEKAAKMMFDSDSFQISTPFKAR